MRTLLASLLVAGVAVNAALLAWQLGKRPGGTAGGAPSETVVMRTPGGVLEVSTVRVEERFDSTTTHTVLGVPVGKTVAQVRVPAVYRYHVPLARDWTLRPSGRTLVAIAPAPRPSLPVAVDTGRLETFTFGTWAPFTGADAIAALQRSITARLADKAATPPMVQLQREAARQTVTEFIQNWVVRQPGWQGDRAPAVFVFFEDEPLGQRAAPLFAEQP